MNKRGLSEVITTVLIILLVLGAIVIIWAVVKPTLDKSASNIQIDTITASLSVPKNSIIIDESNNATFKVKREAGEEEIIAINVVLKTENGDRKVFRIPGGLGELETRTITIPFKVHNITSVIKDISVCAVILGSNGKEISSEICSGTSVPAPLCGDSKVQAGEQCDGGTLNGVIPTIPYNTNGTYCSNLCQNLTLRGPYCGDGTCNTNEETSINCYIDCGSVCGDGTVYGAEQCDGTNLNGQTCVTKGYFTGTLSCSSGCQFDTSGCFDLRNGLVSYYKFDEASYSGTAGEVIDNMGRNNGTSSGGMSTSSGKVGNAARFDGLNDYLSVPNLDGLSFNFSKNFSILAWFKPVSSVDMIIASLTHQSSWQGSNIILFMSDRALEVQIAGFGLFNTSTNSIPINSWTFATWTYSETDRKGTLYLNGVKGSEHTFSQFSQNTNALFRIGRYGGGWYMNGSIDEFMLFNRTLNASDITTIYNSY